ncbi:MAG: MafI family immunity protein, partial [Leptospiraceae bacterium]|nr:MafI family immunity protein [Leptospiraceae bacterium]
RIMHSDVAERIGKLTKEIQKKIDLEFEKVNNKPIPGSNLDQLNLKDGVSTVHEYLSHNEFILAFEHLFYMIEETGIPILSGEFAELLQISEILKINIRTRNINFI